MIDVHAFEHGDLGVHAHDGIVVAVPVNDRADGEARRLVALAFEELRQDEGLTGETLGVLVVGEQADELVTERRDAAGFDTDDRHTGTDHRLQRLEGLPPQSLRRGEHPEVVERSTAAQRSGRDLDEVARILEHLGRCVEDLGFEVVVERVGPEHHPVGGDRLLGAVRVETVLVGGAADTAVAVAARPVFRQGIARCLAVDEDR